MPERPIGIKKCDVEEKKSETRKCKDYSKQPHSDIYPLCEQHGWGLLRENNQIYESNDVDNNNCKNKRYTWVKYVENTQYANHIYCENCIGEN